MYFIGRVVRQLTTHCFLKIHKLLNLNNEKIIPT